LWALAFLGISEQCNFYGVRLLASPPPLCIYYTAIFPLWLISF
jgi:hypothetical protein